MLATCWSTHIQTRWLFVGLHTYKHQCCSQDFVKAWGAQKNFRSPIFSAAQFFPQPNFFRSPIFFPTAKIFLGCTTFFPANIFSSPSIIFLPPPSHKCLPRSSLIHYSGLSTLDLKNITNRCAGFFLDGSCGSKEFEQEPMLE